MVAYVANNETCVWCNWDDTRCCCLREDVNGPTGDRWLCLTFPNDGRNGSEWADAKAGLAGVEGNGKRASAGTNGGQA
jgi:hypothetical protein